MDTKHLLENRYIPLQNLDKAMVNYEEKIKLAASYINDIHKADPNCTLVFESNLYCWVPFLKTYVTGYEFTTIDYPHGFWYNAIKPVVNQ